MTEILTRRKLDTDTIYVDEIHWIHTLKVVAIYSSLPFQEHNPLGTRFIGPESHCSSASLHFGTVILCASNRVGPCDFTLEHLRNNLKQQPKYT
jgi:hypothetical protein